MNTFQRNISKLTNFLRSSEYDGVVHKRLNFEIEKEIHSDPCTWFNIEFLLSMDTVEIYAYRSNFSAEDLNIFLRSWQEGKTNQKLKEILLTTCSDINLKEVLKGCGGELMDPRTTKHKFQYLVGDPSTDVWICGGIHIKGKNGRIAVIEGNCSIEEDVSRTQIEEYLERVEDWNSENKTWFKEIFNIFIF
uniref:FBA_2 domain-containing protein n=1 Tax=Caenorhabditis tropicalis TaxID=1561998 RepID=A0A1I7TTY4_9PELO